MVLALVPGVGPERGLGAVDLPIGHGRGHIVPADVHRLGSKRVHQGVRGLRGTYADAGAREVVHRSQRFTHAEGVAEVLRHEPEPDETVAVQPREHPFRRRARGDPAEQPVIGDQEGCLQRLEARDAHAVPRPGAHPPELEVAIAYALGDAQLIAGAALTGSVPDHAHPHRAVRPR